MQLANVLNEQMIGCIYYILSGTALYFSVTVSEEEGQSLVILFAYFSYVNISFFPTRFLFCWLKWILSIYFYIKVLFLFCVLLLFLCGRPFENADHYHRLLQIIS